jgi:hypothetical protein
MLHFLVEDPNDAFSALRHREDAKQLQLLLQANPTMCKRELKTALKITDKQLVSLLNHDNC